MPEAPKPKPAASREGKFRWWRFAPVIVWLGLIFFASTGTFTPRKTLRLIHPVLVWAFPTASEQQIDRVNLILRKVGHFSEYACLAGLLAWLTITTLPPSKLSWWFTISLVVIALVAASDEFHQRFVPDRNASLADIGLDILGGLTLLSCIAVWRSCSSFRPSQD